MGPGSLHLRRFPIKGLIPLCKSPDADFDRSLWLIADRFVQLAHIGERRRYVSSLHRKKVKLRLSAETLLKHLYIAHELDRLIVADIEDTPGSITGRGIRVITVPAGRGSGRLHHDSGDPLYDVVDIGEIAHHFTSVEHRDRTPGEDSLCEPEQRHIRPTPGTIDGAARRAHEMPDLRLAAAFEHVQEADEVGINVGRGVFNRVTHPCLRG